MSEQVSDYYCHNKITSSKKRHVAIAHRYHNTKKKTHYTYISTRNPAQKFNVQVHSQTQTPNANRVRQGTEGIYKGRQGKAKARMDGWMESGCHTKVYYTTPYTSWTRGVNPGWYGTWVVVYILIMSSLPGPVLGGEQVKG